MKPRTDFIAPAQVAALLREFSQRLWPATAYQHPRILRLCQALLYTLRHPATDAARGRPAQWPRPFLLAAGDELAALLAAQSMAVTPRRFLTYWVPLLSFPADVRQALDTRQVTITEAHLLARLTAQALGESSVHARAARQRILAQHLQKRGTQTSLRRAVTGLLPGQAAMLATEASATIKERVAQTDELLEFDPTDTSHLLWEEMKNLVFLLRAVEASRLPDEVLGAVLELLGQVQWKLHPYTPREPPTEAAA